MATLSDLIHRAQQTLDAAFAGHVASDMTLRQVAVLADISQYPGSNQTEICARTKIDRSTLADIVRRVADAGYVSRRRTKEDARAYAIEITPAGSKALKDALSARAKAEALVEARLSASTHKALLRGLEDIAALDREVKAAA